MRKISDRSSTPAPMADTRRVWVKPAYSRMRAGDAELGPNPTPLSDGPLTFS